MAASQTKPVYGLLGRKLGHSYSPRIHAMLGDYEYRLHEVEPDDVAAFIREGDFAGLNVTMPYKETVMDLCDKLTDAAKKIGNVNTIVRREDGTLLGDNTDYYGFSHLLNGRPHERDRPQSRCAWHGRCSENGACRAYRPRRVGNCHDLAYGREQLRKHRTALRCAFHREHNARGHVPQLPRFPY